MSEQEWMERLSEDGFVGLTICANPPDKDFGRHTHNKHTVHVILEGELVLTDEEGTKILRRGDRFEITAGTTHEAKCGPAGCTFIVGVRTAG